MMRTPVCCVGLTASQGSKPSHVFGQECMVVLARLAKEQQNRESSVLVHCEARCPLCMCILSPLCSCIVRRGVQAVCAFAAQEQHSTGPRVVWLPNQGSD
jgi:hypothetical protein